MRPLRWVDRQVRIWWPAAAALVGGAILATLGFVVTTVVDDRAQLREQRDLLAEQSEQLARVVERNRRADAESGEQLRDAIGEVEELLIDHFAVHDTNVAAKLNDMLHRIAALLGRPAGTPPNPVTAQPAPTGTAPAPGAAPSPAPRSGPTTRTTTTTPDQKSCTKRPGGPRC